jgi:hypothetical protein
MKFLAGFAVALTVLAANAHAAAVFASGKVYGGASQNDVVCYIFNSGSTPVTIFSVAINDESGNQTATSSTCNPDGTPLAAGTGCLIAAASISSTSAYDCVITATNSDGLRGSLEIRDPNGVLQAQSLR